MLQMRIDVSRTQYTKYGMRTRKLFSFITRPKPRISFFKDRQWCMATPEPSPWITLLGGGTVKAAGNPKHMMVIKA